MVALAVVLCLSHEVVKDKKDKNNVGFMFECLVFLHVLSYMQESF